MAQSSKIIGYKKIFGFILPDWVDERTVNLTIGYMMVSLVMVFALLLFIRPQKDNVASLEAKYKSDSSRLEGLKSSRDSLNQLIQQVSPDEQSAVFRAMPLNYSPDDAVFSLRRVANATGVSITDYSLPNGTVFEAGAKEFTGGSSNQNTSTTISFKSFLVSITIEGKIQNILNFVDQVQKSLPVAFVADLGIQEVVTGAVKGVSGDVSLRLQVQYYQPILKSFNVAELKNFSNAELNLVKELAGYATEFPSIQYSSSSASPQFTPQTNIFGL